MFAANENILFPRITTLRAELWNLPTRVTHTCKPSPRCSASFNLGRDLPEIRTPSSSWWRCPGGFQGRRAGRNATFSQMIFREEAVRCGVLPLLHHSGFYIKTWKISTKNSCTCFSGFTSTTGLVFPPRHFLCNLGPNCPFSCVLSVFQQADVCVHVCVHICACGYAYVYVCEHVVCVHARELCSCTHMHIC